MKKIALLFSLLFLVVSFSCKEEKEEDNAPEAVKDTSGNLNVSILLDLSDRISPQKYPNPTMEYYLRDVGYINSVYDAFSQHIKGKKIMQMDDRLQLFFDPPPLNPDINSISKSLKIELNKGNVSNELLADIEKKYKSEPLKLYQLAIKDNNYVGSDTWTFFKNRIDDYCIDDNHRNILVILTDGYIFYKNSLMQEGNMTSFLTPERIRQNGLNVSSWSDKFNSEKLGFLKANNDLSNLEILVLGINPSPNNPYEEEVIKAYWTKWFEDMKVKHYEIRSTDLPSNVDKVIREFVLGK
jgi:hypothetical protein